LRLRMENWLLIEERWSLAQLDLLTLTYRENVIKLRLSILLLL
jgi:hypothetical protein